MDVLTTIKEKYKDDIDYSARSLGNEFKLMVKRHFDSYNQTYKFRPFFCRDGYEFLIEGDYEEEKDGTIVGHSCSKRPFREDSALLPEAITMKIIDYKDSSVHGEGGIKRSYLYVQRGLPGWDYIIDYDLLPSHRDVHKRNFKNINFEKLIALELYDGEGDFYHTYSGGVDLFGFNEKTPQKIKDDLTSVLVKAFRELHEAGIEYTDPLPTNMRYNFDRKIILNPHNCMLYNLKNPFPDPDDIRQATKRSIHEKRKFVDVSRDLGLLLYTNPWIDPEHFVESYLGSKIDDSTRISLLRAVDCYFGQLDDAVVDGVQSIWSRESPKGKGNRIKSDLY